MTIRYEGDIWKVIEECKKIRDERSSAHQDTWLLFSIPQLLMYASLKAWRAALCPDKAKIKDDAIDALNFIVFALNKIKLSESVPETMNLDEYDNADILDLLEKIGRILIKEELDPRKFYQLGKILLEIYDKRLERGELSDEDIAEILASEDLEIQGGESNG